jgi:hypothetical protein
MRSESRSDGGNGAEMDTAPSVAMTTEALESQLTMALDAADTPQARFHLRQALQLVEALDE